MSKKEPSAVREISGVEIKRYRCNHTVEAMQWTGENFDALRAFHKAKSGHDAKYEDGVAIVLLDTLGVEHPDGKYGPGEGDDDWVAMQPGEWLLYMGTTFVTMEDAAFREDYDEVEA